MLLVFDLDDTLYVERTYVESGLQSVAAWGEATYGLDASASFIFMIQILETDGRGAIFDRWLDHHGLLSKARVKACVRHYRHHTPKLELNDAAKTLLPQLSSHALYIVTDGHKVVQSKKLQSLGVEPLFRKVFVTHRYGIRHSKPSIYCFDRILKLEGANWGVLVYIGYNPNKDFVGLNTVGAKTVRVLTGWHKDVIARTGYEAQHRITDLSRLHTVLPGLEG